MINPLPSLNSLSSTTSVQSDPVSVNNSLSESGSISKVHTVAILSSVVPGDSSAVAEGTTASAKISASTTRKALTYADVEKLLYEDDDTCTALDRLPQATLKRLFNESLKGEISAESLSTLHQGQSLRNALSNRFEKAAELLTMLFSDSPPDTINTEQEKLGLFRISQHRLNMLRYSEKFEDFSLLAIPGLSTNFSNSPKMLSCISEIQDNIRCLDDPTSNKVITLEDGSTCFSLPAVVGSKSQKAGHALSYEFRKSGDDYFFVIHNRGGACDSVAPIMHGSNFYKLDDKTYGRTSIPIKVSKEHLLNESFIRILIDPFQELVPYSFIYRHLIQEGGGEIIETEGEKLIKQLDTYISLSDVEMGKELKTKLEKLRNKLIKLDENIHSWQLFGTCTVSNFTEAEKRMAPPSVIKALKLFTLKESVKEVSSSLQSLSSLDKTNPGVHFHKLSKTIKDDITLKAAEPKLFEVFEKYTRDAELAINISSNKEAKLIKKLKNKEPKEDIASVIADTKRALEEAAQMRRHLAEIRDAIMTIIRIDPSYFASVDDKLPNYKELVLEAVKIEPEIFAMVSKDFPNYEQLQLEVIKSNYKMIDFMKDSPNFAGLLLEAVKINVEAFKYVLPTRSDYKVLALMVMKENGTALKYVPTDREDYFEIASEAIKNKPNVILHVPKERSDYALLQEQAGAVSTG